MYTVERDESEVECQESGFSIIIQQKVNTSRSRGEGQMLKGLTLRAGKNVERKRGEKGDRAMNGRSGGKRMEDRK